MNIAICSIYGESYSKDKMFDANACNIGQNLLMPNIMLKKELEKDGNNVHTIDMNDIDQIDKVIFMDIPYNSMLTTDGIMGYLKYFLKRKWKNDYLYKLVHKLDKNDIILQINEPPTVWPLSYKKELHKYFGKVMTWCDDDIGGNCIKYCIPQYWDGKVLNYQYKDKRDFVIIAGNKQSEHINELYSERRSVIDYFEANNIEGFDLYGFGWEKELLNNYKGKVDDKLGVLSKYKFSFCFENIKDMNGYITEKIFDCFFAGVVPIYIGASNIDKYVPSKCFIDYRQFESIEQVVDFANNIGEEQYIEYQNNAIDFLNSELFKNNFSVDKYVEKMKACLLER